MTQNRWSLRIKPKLNSLSFVLPSIRTLLISLYTRSFESYIHARVYQVLPSDSIRALNVVLRSLVENLSLSLSHEASLSDMCVYVSVKYMVLPGM